MRRFHQALALLACIYITLAIAACSGGSSGPTCSFDNPATFVSTSAWPKFRKDQANTGALSLTDAAAFAVLAAPTANKQARVFPDGDPKGSFSASPVISDDGSIVYIGSNDGTLYGINTATWTQKLAFNLVTAEPISAAALVAQRSGKDVIFAGSLDGQLHGVDEDSVIQATNWPFSVGIPIDAAPNLGSDGTVYTGSSGGLFVAVCPNGIMRFSLSLGAVTPPAIGPDDIIYVAADDAQLRAFRYDGLPRWTVSASQPISTAPVVEFSGQTTNAIYVADGGHGGGRIFKIDKDGGPVSGFHFAAGSPINSSPALADGRLYFGTDDGNIHAILTSDGSEIAGWPIHTGGPVLSSPAVAVFGSDHVVVVGSDDGGVYFVNDDGTAPPTVARFPVGAAVRSSPAIGFDGSVYVGAEDGRVYAIGSTPS